MPGSLLLRNDVYSDLSTISERSLDSKIGGKKVSFNKAVRVKQYPQKPELNVTTAEPLILPSNKFWFKVYKNKQDSFNSQNCNAVSSKPTEWDEESLELIQESLAPIEEVEDQDINLTHADNFTMDSSFNSYKMNSEKSHDLDCNNSYQPIDPPVDYLNDMSTLSRNEIKHAWGNNELNNNPCNFNNNPSNDSLHRIFTEIGHHPEVIMKKNESFPDASFSRPVGQNLKPLRFRSDDSTRRSIKNLDTTDSLVLRERRSRSHDYYNQSNNRFKSFQKTDKSVSTDDLNTDSKFSIPTNQFLKSSRDTATQCWGTLNRNKDSSKLRNSIISSSSQTESCLSTMERLKSFKCTTPKQSYTSEQNNRSCASSQKDYTLEKVCRPRDISKMNNATTLRSQNRKPFNRDSHLKEKLSRENLKPLTQTENSISNILQRQSNKTFNKSYSKNSSNPSTLLNKATRKKQENIPQNNEIRSPVGYLKGHQIPLNEVNTNRKRANNDEMYKSHISCKAYENISASPNRSMKSNEQVLSGFKRYPPNIPERRSFRNKSTSAKSYPSSYSEEGNSMIDWSGFQLARKPENRLQSNSEYSGQKRLPLLMYIPGVSHHDRPAVEDDVLSVLSNLSRSDLNDSLLGSTVNNNKYEFRRRLSMKEGKSKWLKW